MPSAWGHTRLLETDWRLITQESHCFSCGSVKLIEIIGGFWTNSMAILSDAVHDLGDSISLGVAWYLERYASKEHDEKFSFGYARFSLLAALLNSLILVAGSV